MQTELLDERLSDIVEALLAIDALFVPSSPFATATKFLDKPCEIVLFVGVPACRFRGQGMNQLSLRSLPCLCMLRVWAVWRAGVDLADETVGKLEAFVVVEDEFDKHPEQGSVTTDLPNHHIERLDGPGYFHYLTCLLIHEYENILFNAMKELDRTWLIRCVTFSYIQPVQG